MRVFKKRPKANSISRAHALAYTPVKSIQIKEVRLETGEVLIEYPTSVRPLIAAVAKRLGEIVTIFAETHRLENREAEISVTQFIRELGRRGLIGLR